MDRGPKQTMIFIFLGMVTRLITGCGNDGGRMEAVLEHDGCKSEDANEYKAAEGGGV